MSEIDRIVVTITIDTSKLSMLHENEPVADYALRLVRHSTGIMKAKEVNQETPLGKQTGSIALNIMRRYAIPRLEFHEPCSLGELIQAVKRQTEGSVGQ